MSNRCNEPFNLDRVPAGAKTSRRFPWWQTGVYSRLGYSGDSTVGTGEQFFFRPISRSRGAIGSPYLSGGASLFNNPMPWPIKITEIRFIMAIEYQPKLVTLAKDMDDYGRQIGVKIESTFQGKIVKEFVPMSALHTDQRMDQEFDPCGFTITLPDDYFMPSDADFGAMFDSFGRQSTSRIQIGIRGCDPYNNTPVARFSQSLQLRAGAGDAGTQFIISGTAGGQAIRNMWMRDITIANYAEYGQAVFGTDGCQQLMAAFKPPQGPKWTTDIATPITGLVDQVSTTSVRDSASPIDLDGWRRLVTVHKPVMPYTLLPQDVMNIEGMLFSPIAAAIPDTDEPAKIDFDLFCVVKGYQEVPNDAI